MTKRKIWTIGAIVVVFTLSCATYHNRPLTVEKRVERSPQFSDGKFSNPGENIHFSLGKTASGLWEFLFGKEATTPTVELPRQPIDLEAFLSGDSATTKVAWLGHSSLIIKIAGSLVLADPVFEKSISIFGPTRYSGDPPIDIDDLPEIDLVLITHDHYDHLNRYTIEKIHERTTLFIAPLRVGKLLSNWGVPENKIVELDWWEETEIGGRLTVVCTPTQHFSGRGLTDRNETLWCSYVIETDEHGLFFGGDSGYFEGFKEIGRKYGPFDITFLECGAYNERWTEIHMMPEHTVQAHLDLGGKVLHPIHWGTFDLAMHPWYDPMQRLVAAADSAGVQTATPVAGGVTTVGSPIPDTRWWETALAVGLEESFD